MLMRTLTRVDPAGKIAIPRNIRLALGLKEQDIVELKVAGGGKAKKIVVSKRKNCR